MVPCFEKHSTAMAQSISNILKLCAERLGLALDEREVRQRRVVHTASPSRSGSCISFDLGKPAARCDDSRPHQKEGPDGDPPASKDVQNLCREPAATYILAALPSPTSPTTLAGQPLSRCRHVRLEHCGSEMRAGLRLVGELVMSVCADFFLLISFRSRSSTGPLGSTQGTEQAWCCIR